MAEDRDQWADTLSAQHHGGWLTSFLAEEDKLDRRMLWRLGSWGAGAVAAVTVAVLAGQSQSQLRREQFAAAELMDKQSQQIQFVARETQTESKRLSHAIDTLNGDRDRLYARVTTVEQGLESVTGSIKRQSAGTAAAPAAPVTVEPSPAPQAAAPVATPPLIGPVASSTPVEPPAAKTTAKETAKEAARETAKEAAKEAAAKDAPVKESPAKEAAKPAAAAAPPIVSEPLVAWKSMMAYPDAAASKLIPPPASPAAAPEAPQVVASAPAAVAPAVAPPVAEETPATPVARTEFGIDVGGANSVDGLRALWRSTASSNKALAGLRPIMMVKERSTGLGMQLRLVLGPISDAATAAKICAIMTENNRTCETSVFDGQRLALKNDTPPAETAAPARPAPRKRGSVRNERTERAPPPPAPVEEPPPKPQSSLTSFLGIR